MFYKGPMMTGLNGCTSISYRVLFTSAIFWKGKNAIFFIWDLRTIHRHRINETVHVPVLPAQASRDSCGSGIDI